jgi:hypothetical protein
MHDDRPYSPAPIERHAEKPEEALVEVPAEGKRVKRSDLLNLFNLVNFMEGTVFVRFTHRGQGNTLFLQAHPLPCSSETLVCRWIAPGMSLKRLESCDFDSLVLLDGHSRVSVAAEMLSINSDEVSFRIPLSGYENGIRAMDRHACEGITARILQAGMSFEGSLEDFNAVSFRLEVEGPSSAAFRWINVEQPVMALFSRGGTLLYSGECLVTRVEKGFSRHLLVLAPNFTSIRRYKAREYRCQRQVLLPAPTVRFSHSLTDKQVYLKVENISGTGICVEEFLERSLLVPGMIIPELSLEIANSFILKCRAQVLYRNVTRKSDEYYVVRCGMVFLDLQPEDQVRLAAIIHQSVDDRLRVCSSVEMDELWRFFFESGFIYPSKYLSVQARKEEFKLTYTKLYLESSSIARHFFFQDKGQIFGHMSMLRYYPNSWIIHHHAASRSGYGLAGVGVLDEMGRFTNDVHLHPSAHMDYLMCYFRRENRFPNRVFGNVAHDIADKKGSSLDGFAYLWLPAQTEDETASFQLFPARDEDLQELARRYEAMSGGLMLDAFDLRAISGSDAELSSEYSKQGFKRERYVFCLKQAGKLQAIVLLTLSDLGLNLSNLTNCIHVLVMEPDLLDPKTLFSSLHSLRAHYDSDELPVLVFPEDYLERHSVPCEKKYVLWVLDTSYSDPYFDSVQTTFKRPGNGQCD